MPSLELGPDEVPMSWWWLVDRLKATTSLPPG
jgi:hypothetical protein